MMQNGASPLKYSAEEYLHLASRFRAAGDLSAALAYVGSALETSPEDDRAHFLLASLHADAGLLARAIREYQELLQRKPDWLPVRFNLGVLWLNAPHDGGRGAVHGCRSEQGPCVGKVLRSDVGSCRE